MKHFIYLLLVGLVFTACKEEAPKDYVTFSGTITNQNSDSLFVRSRTVSKVIKVKPDGTFSDTLKVEPGVFLMYDGAEQARLYLKNGYDLKMKLDTKSFDETIAFEGTGAEASNYLAKKALLMEEVFDIETLFELDQAAFNEEVKKSNKTFKDLLDNAGDLDSLFIVSEEKEAVGLQNQLQEMYAQKQQSSALNGTESPKFVDYENYNGGNTSLDDLKGKYVYIDVWATWCGPCLAEIPSLKAVEKEYHGKNIQFVSISVDDQNAHAKWRTMIEEKELGGVQLFAKEDRSFVTAYNVTGIPRFILIDPEGNIVKADAPRPSSPQLKTLLESLAI
ncbi:MULTISPECIES: TlpA disulfide reductase family protein [unclassified Algibacter]|uniref:TlpA family protein disulfide reductase n=1 Tax=unclassified Algibacter TaxID=2615009 RepID=UPI00131AA898|nr:MULTISPECIES: TlpA disulfide reductase family protein [unclassified Algibacter]MCL5129835.1 TlpA family protein disulfide reductase [Algibacter sp. L4_22]